MTHSQPMPSMAGVATRVREMSDRRVAAVACFLVHVILLAGCAKVGAVRVADLAVTALVLVISYALALRDHPKLPLYTLTVWVFAPLVRRLIDWRFGGFVSLTAVSILPIMATANLVIPTYPRWNKLKRSVRQPWMLIVTPVVIATMLGVALYGAAAGPAALKWLMPMLFVPYFATRSTDPQALTAVTRGLIVCAAISGAYAIYQFAFLPAWDRMWLIQSGMTSSMGKPYPTQIRAWGTMNSCGPAAQVWALSIIAGLMDTKWKSSSKKVLLAVSLVALLLSLVRSAWLMLCIGVIVMAAQAGGKRLGAAVFAVMLMLAGAMLAPLLPGGDRITRRLETFENLGDDRSFMARNRLYETFVDQLLENPLGRGIGFSTASRVSGASNKGVAIDNGFAELALNISLPGAAIWCFGVYMLGAAAFRYSKKRTGAAVDQSRGAVTVLCMTGAAMLAGFSFSGIVGAVTWCLVGIGLSLQAAPLWTPYAQTAPWTPNPSHQPITDSV